MPMRLYFCMAAMAVCVLTITFGAGRADADALIEALGTEGSLSLCDEPVPMSDPRMIERFEKEMLVSLGNRGQVILWLKRSARYFPFIRKSLAENGLPDDLKYLAVAESALRMHAGSPKGAMGVWQLMPQTARKFGLTVNGSFDERRNVYLSTPVALTYLKALYEQFGSWSLSLAAYNMGEEGLEAEILEQGISDYYRLYLPLETQRFVFRILAIKAIMANPERYGFSLSADAYYAPESFSTVSVQALSEMPLRLIARAAETDFKSIKDLNPEIRGHYLAAGTRRVNIPGGDAPAFAKRLSDLVAADASIRSQRIYVVKKGDSLSSIAKAFDIPLAALLIWNRIGVREVIHPGQRLVIFPGADMQRTPRQDLDGEAVND